MTHPDLDLPVFGRASRHGCESSSSVELPGQSAIGRVGALLFDHLDLQAGAGEPLNGWRIEVVSIPLLRPSRRRIRVTVRGQLMVVCKGWARVGLSCESRQLSTQVISRESQPLPNGALPEKSRPLRASIVLPRSVLPRTALQVLIRLEATADSSETQSAIAVDSIEIEAL
ncbi:hypothetical protein [Ideonella alba]|uniref:Uncharacterized protein n=1 Tax=Ideonella alba TaxID=2824118 RepID=A0A940YDI7_9BURK|nr:hypothetical protein [Ideonella alba]MBQ0931166.1 hypothetical protein [Ideonella alba]